MGELDQWRSVEDEEKVGAGAEDQGGTQDAGASQEQGLKGLGGGMEGGQHRWRGVWKEGSTDGLRGQEQEESELARAPAGPSSRQEQC